MRIAMPLSVASQFVFGSSFVDIITAAVARGGRQYWLLRAGTKSLDKVNLTVRLNTKWNILTGHLTSDIYVLVCFSLLSSSCKPRT